MTLIDNKERILKFIICINVLLLVILVAKSLFTSKNSNKDYNYVSTSVIKNESENAKIYVEYPRFNNNDEVNKIITDIIYGYIKDFKNSESDKSLDITYKTYYIEDYVNITFHIEDTLSRIKNKNVLINLRTNQLSNITSLYDKGLLENTINKLAINSYQKDIYDKIVNENINDFTYIIDIDNIEVYFNNIDWSNIDFIPYVSIDLNESIIYSNNSSGKYKYIAFTYDNGPSEYTSELLDIINSNNSSATFFVTGNNIKGREDIIEKISNSNNEVGSNGYSHVNLNKLSKQELNTEVNSTSELLYSITNKNVEFLRPPFGEYNENVINLPYDVILWNIDSKDWIVRNENKIYNNVMNNACDGCIVLMHDSYQETLEATKRLIPDLKKKGYIVVSVSKLMEKKNFEKSKNSVINYIK